MAVDIVDFSIEHGDFQFVMETFTRGYTSYFQTPEKDSYAWNPHPSIMIHHVPSLWLPWLMVFLQPAGEGGEGLWKGSVRISEKDQTMAISQDGFPLYLADFWDICTIWTCISRWRSLEALRFWFEAVSTTLDKVVRCSMRLNMKQVASIVLAL